MGLEDMLKKKVLGKEEFDRRRSEKLKDMQEELDFLKTEKEYREAKAELSRLKREANPVTNFFKSAAGLYEKERKRRQAAWQR